MKKHSFRLLGIILLAAALPGLNKFGAAELTPQLRFEWGAQGGTKLTLISPPGGKLYRLECSGDLKDWKTLEGGLGWSNAKGDPVEWLDSAKRQAAKYYRVRQIEERLWGAVALDSPLVGATLTVFDAQGRKLLEQTNATSESGLFDLPLNLPPKDLKVVAEHGTLNGEPFAGSVRAEIPDFDGKTFLAVNPVSSLIAAYWLEHPELSLREASGRVNEFLLAPAEADVVGMLGWGVTSFFYPATFMKEAAMEGGFDLFVTQLVAEIDAGGLRPFGPPQEFFGDLLWNAVKWTGQQIASGAVSGIASKGIGMGLDAILEIFGLANHTERQLREIKEQLDAMDKKLDRIQSSLDYIQGSLGEIQSQISETAWRALVSRTSGPIGVITSAQTEYKARIKVAAKELGTNYLSYTNFAYLATNRFASNMVNQIGAFQNPDTSRSVAVSAALEELAAQLEGDPFTATPGLLKEFALRLSERGINDRIVAYRAMENFFSRFLLLEFQALNLKMEAQPLLELKREYIQEFAGSHLIPQVNLFLNGMEMVVLSDLDSRWAEFLPDVSSEMLVPAYQLASAVLSGYGVSTETGTVTVRETNQTVLTAAVALVGDTSGWSTNATLGLKNLNTGAIIEVPIARLAPDSASLAATTVNLDGGKLTIARFWMNDAPNGTYQLKPGTGYSPIYTNTTTINGADTNLLFGTICLPAWAPRAESINKPAPQLYRIAAKFSGKLLEFAGPTTIDRARVQQWSQTKLDNQKWKFERKGIILKNYWINKEAGHYLDWEWPAAGPVVFGGLSLEREWVSYAGWSDKAWNIPATSSRLSIPGHIDTLGHAAFIESDSNAGAYGWWSEEDAGNGYVYLKNTGSGRYLEIVGPTTAVEAHLQTAASTGSNNQNWLLQYVGGGSYAVQNYHAGHYMDLWEGFGYDGAEIRSNTRGLINQSWRIDVLGDGSYRITSASAPGRQALTVDGGSAVEGAAALSWHWYDNYNQKWLLTPSN